MMDQKFDESIQIRLTNPSKKTNQNRIHQHNIDNCDVLEVKTFVYGNKHTQTLNTR